MFKVERGTQIGLLRCLINLAVTLMSFDTAIASILETDQVDRWTLNAYSNTKTGKFHNCSMRTVGEDHVSLVVSANARNNWYLWLHRPSWDIDPADRFVATLNFDGNRKQPIALDAKLSDSHYVALVLPSTMHLLEQFSKATTVRVSREASAYNFQLAGYDKAVAWVKACVIRYRSAEDDKPDATIRQQDDESDEMNGESPRKSVPAESVKPPVKLPAGVIEANADEPRKPASGVSTVVAKVVATASAAGEATLGENTVQPGSKPSNQQTAHQLPVDPVGRVGGVPMSDAASATLTPVAADPGYSLSESRRLVTDLVSSLSRTDFGWLTPSAAASVLPDVRTAFSLQGVTGVVAEANQATSAATLNEALAYDRIGCSGDYATSNLPSEDLAAKATLHASSTCKSGETVRVSHVIVMAKKGGGQYVVSLTLLKAATDQTDASDGPASVVAGAMVNAAMKVSDAY